MIYLCNAFSVHMLQEMKCGESEDLRISRISAMQAGAMLRSKPFRSFYGHSRSAYHLGRYLRVNIPVSRGIIRLGPGDMILIAAIDSKRMWEAGVRGCPGWTFYLVEPAS